MLKCNFVFRGVCLLTFSHDAEPILASPESIAGGAPNCKTGELCEFMVFKGVLYLLPKISMFCALSQNNQYLFEK